MFIDRPKDKTLHTSLTPSRRRLLHWGAALPTLLIAARRSTASMVLAMELPEIAAASDAIVVAQVLSSHSHFEDDHHAIRTEVQLSVQESWKGQFLGKTRTIKVVQPGGVVGDLEMRVHGLPTFSANEKSVLFLTARDKAHAEFGFILTGLGQGKRRLFADARGEWMAAPPDRSAAVLKSRTGAFAPASPEPAIRLADLRQQVKLLLEAQGR